jgi:hypothetical protein
LATERIHALTGAATNREPLNRKPDNLADLFISPIYKSRANGYTARETNQEQWKCYGIINQSQN